MVKKAQISTFVIIGIVLVILVSLVVYFNFQKQKEEIVSDTGRILDFSGVKNNLKTYVNVCLEQTTLDAIDRYGFIDSSEQISLYVETNILGCLNDFAFDQYDVEYGEREAETTISNSIVQVELYFPISVSQGTDKVTADEFKYLLFRTETLPTDNGILKAGTSLYFGDEDMVLRVNEDTKVTDANGEPVDEIFVKILDNNFDGLNNRVIIGQVAYDAGPDGVTFEPPIEMRLRIRKEEVPESYEGHEPKLSWYDEENDIWRTYESCEFLEDDNYYYYCGKVDHFTPVAVVACGNEDTEFNLRLEYIYQSPIKSKKDASIDDVEWLPNMPDDSKGRHVSVESMSFVDCLFLKEDKVDSFNRLITELESAVVVSITNYVYEVSGTEAGNFQAILEDLTDEQWIEVEMKIDNVKGVTSVKSKKKYNVDEETDFPKEGTAREQCMFMLRDWDKDDDGIHEDDYTYNNEAHPDSAAAPPPNINANDAVRDKCRDVCSASAKEKIQAYFEDGGKYDKIDIFNGMSDDEKKENIVPILVEGVLGNGDGLKKGAELSCQIKSFGAEFNILNDEFICNFGTDVDASSNIVDFSELRIIATPNTYGFSDLDPDYDITGYTRENTFEMPEDYEYAGGYGVVEFNFLDKGDSCVDAELGNIELITPKFKFDQAVFDSFDASIDYENCNEVNPGEHVCGGDIIGSFYPDNPQSIIVDKNSDSSGLSCSVGDTCVWTLNNGGEMSTENYVNVRVQNEFESNDGDAFASAVLKFSGTGVIGHESCSVTVGERLNYLRGCGAGSEPEGNAEYECLKSNDVNMNLCEVECEDFVYNEESTVGGICVGNMKVCPGYIEGGDGSVDSDCFCGINQYSSADSMFCCNGELIADDADLDTDECWQESPLTLRPNYAEVGEVALYAEVGDLCKYKGATSIGVCVNPSAECAGGTLVEDMGYCGEDLICCASIVGMSRQPCGESDLGKCWGDVSYNEQANHVPTLDEVSCGNNMFCQMPEDSVIGKSCYDEKGTCQKLASSECPLDTETLVTGQEDYCGFDNLATTDEISCCVPKDEFPGVCCVYYDTNDPRSGCVYTFQEGTYYDCTADERAVYNDGGSPMCNAENTECVEQQGCCVELSTSVAGSSGVLKSSCTETQVFAPNCDTDTDEIQNLILDQRSCCVLTPSVGGTPLYYSSISVVGVAGEADCSGVRRDGYTRSYEQSCRCSERDCIDYDTATYGGAPDSFACCLSMNDDRDIQYCYDTVEGTKVERSSDCDEVGYYDPAAQEFFDDVRFEPNCGSIQNGATGYTEYTCYNFDVRDTEFYYDQPVCAGTRGGLYIDPGLPGYYPSGWKACNSNKKWVYTCTSDGDWDRLGNACGKSCVEMGDGQAYCQEDQDDTCAGTITRPRVDPHLPGMFNNKDLVCGSSTGDSAQKKKAYICTDNGDWDGKGCGTTCSTPCLWSLWNDKGCTDATCNFPCMDGDDPINCD